MKSARTEPDVSSADEAQPNTKRRLYRTASVLQLVQGVLMEGLPALALPVLLLLGVGESTLAHGVSFIVPEFNNNLYLMMVMSGIFGALRTIGAIGLWRNRMWGLALSTINCVVTMVLMIFMLPAGIADGLLSGGALVCILLAWFGRRGIL